MSGYEIELCYKMMIHAYQSTEIDMKPSQVKKILSLFFSDDVIVASEAIVVGSSKNE